jgi:hypothetical protein
MSFCRAIVYRYLPVGTPVSAARRCGFCYLPHKTPSPPLATVGINFASVGFSPLLLPAVVNSPVLAHDLGSVGGLGAPLGRTSARNRYRPQSETTTPDSESQHPALSRNRGEPTGSIGDLSLKMDRCKAREKFARERT